MHYSCPKYASSIKIFVTSEILSWMHMQYGIVISAAQETITFLCEFLYSSEWNQSSHPSQNITCSEWFKVMMSTSRSQLAVLSYEE